MEINLKTWNGLETNYQIENSLLVRQFENWKTEMKIVKCGVLQSSRAFAFSDFRKRPQQYQ